MFIPASIATLLQTPTTRISRLQVCVYTRQAYRTVSLHMKRPCLPEAPISSSSLLGPCWDPKDVKTLTSSLATHRSTSDGVYQSAQKLTRLTIAATARLHRGEMSEADELLNKESKAAGEELAAAAAAPGGSLAGGMASSAHQAYTTAATYAHFLTSGCMLPLATMQTLLSSPSSGSTATFTVAGPDYVGGACGLAQELVRYAINRAISRDVGSVLLARDMILEINRALLRFDFRNGQLRRRYDGVKYALLQVEDVVYALSVSGAAQAAALAAAAVPEGEEPGEEGSGAVVDHAEMDAISAEMSAVAARRDKVIKQSRDVQKLAKNSVFSLHRAAAAAAAIADAATAAGIPVAAAAAAVQTAPEGAVATAPDAAMAADAAAAANWVPAWRGDVPALAEARKSIASALVLAEAMLAEAGDDPALRSGAASASLEEWAEAFVYERWLSTGRIPGPGGMPLLSESEYLGGVMDATGEFGRLAVARATARDSEGLLACLRAVEDVAAAVAAMDVPRGLARKVDALTGTMRKLEQV
ncbi:unnamed protein product, partial [Phaeothamnion confervicola]